jgi:hypothetical protein
MFFARKLPNPRVCPNLPGKGYFHKSVEVELLCIVPHARYNQTSSVSYLPALLALPFFVLLFGFVLEFSD